MAFLLLMAISFSLLPKTASADIFDWIRGDNKNEYRTTFLSFAGISEDGLKSTDEKSVNSDTEEKIITGSFFNSSAIVAMNVPLPNKKTVAPTNKKTYLVHSTAYSSTKDQTDDTPFITAMGTHVRDGVVAANFLPLGKVIKIPDHFGDKTFVVEDRMNKRYDFRLDLWFPTREEAKQWGLRKIKIEIIS